MTGVRRDPSSEGIGAALLHGILHYMQATALNGKSHIYASRYTCTFFNIPHVRSRREDTVVYSCGVPGPAVAEGARGPCTGWLDGCSAYCRAGMGQWPAVFLAACECPRSWLLCAAGLTSNHATFQAQ